MANLNKLLVHVPSSLCDDFRNKYIKDGANRDKSYDSKVVFLEDTKEIFTKGKIYGINIEDFNALKKLVSTLPEGTTDIVDYINEKINNANHIHSVSTKSGENLIAVDTKNKAVTVSSTKDLKTAVNNANSALQTVTVLGKELYNLSGTDITVEEAKSYLGLGTDYKDMTYIGTYVHSTAGDYANTAYENAVSYVRTLFPEVKAKDGSIIKVEPSTNPYGKTTYKISTSAEVFHYKGNKSELINLQSTGNTIGDVWSVGPTNSKGSTLYAWDGDEWINLGGAMGVTGVDETSISHGVKLVKNQDGTVKAFVKPGSIASGDDSVVTGGAVYSYINNLGGNASSGNTSSYVTVTVETSGGKVSKVTVTDTQDLKNAVNNANSAIQRVRNLNDIISGDKYLNLSYQKDGHEFFIGLEKTQVFNYVTNNIWETYSV